MGDVAELFAQTAWIGGLVILVSLLVFSSMLHKLVERLDRAAEAQIRAATALEANVETVRQLAVEDRAQLARLVRLLDQLDNKVMVGAATSRRIEAAATEVAEDLAAAHKRADETVGPHGAAADAASISGPSS